jgi:hypothetical protein
MRAADWKRDSGALLDVVDIVTPADPRDDSKNMRLPVPTQREDSFIFWRIWQPVQDQLWRAKALLRHMERLLQENKRPPSQGATWL